MDKHVRVQMLPMAAAMRRKGMSRMGCACFVTNLITYDDAMKLWSNVFHAASYVLLASFAAALLLYNVVGIAVVLLLMALVGGAGTVFALYVKHVTGEADSCLVVSLSTCSAGLLIGLLVLKEYM